MEAIITCEKCLAGVTHSVGQSCWEFQEANNE